MNVYEKLLAIQSELKAPKNQYNSFGNYHYRSCEDILEGVKPLLLKHNLVQKIEDEVVMIGNRYYVKATVTIIDPLGLGGGISVSSFAREEENKKGMDGSQITGSTSSYARKYALNGLYAIDDTKDSDATNVHSKETSKTDTKGKSGKTDPPPVNAENLLCEGCGAKVSTSVAKFSTSKYQKPLCMDCQKKA